MFSPYDKLWPPPSLNDDYSPTAHMHETPIMQRSAFCACVDAVWHFFLFRILVPIRSHHVNLLPALGLEILGCVLEALLNADSVNSWRRIFILIEGDLNYELKRLSAEEKTLNDQVHAQLFFHRKEFQETGWAVLPTEMLHDRNNRRKSLMAIQKQVTRMNTRRTLYHRALWYSEMLDLDCF
ncbi:uncharacterized protein FTJAE_11422 [Fusarium tjaetaba]|uniref:Uncharacterized protein n=1 Tax=Fusarium tjaetaba TaxID=1567544 RepID=A0A8H5QWH8_9HYPO|nr:uncharacterized protein FTJAE_11422 [Fusarium tjaetaba]KAF5621081.1 hypothetical protein FTJAE_11422 [Fusarium tjaetaba]